MKAADMRLVPLGIFTMYKQVHRTPTNKQRYLPFPMSIHDPSREKKKSHNPSPCPSMIRVVKKKKVQQSWRGMQPTTQQTEKLGHPTISGCYVLRGPILPTQVDTNTSPTPSCWSASERPTW